MKTPKESQMEPHYPVGSQVSFLFGQDRVTGLVVEDRGAIGVGGRHLFRIEAPLDSEPPLVLELPAEQLQPA
jgi:primosomal protein N'